MKRLGTDAMPHTLACKVEASDYLEFIKIARLKNEPNTSRLLRRLVKETINNWQKSA